jgi:hypothetical protein
MPQSSQMILVSVFFCYSIIYLCFVGWAAGKTTLVQSSRKVAHISLPVILIGAILPLLGLIIFLLPRR